jgi:hypothetical protein
MPKAAKAMKPWTPAEIQKLRAIAKSGKSAREASKILRRPHPGLRYKAMVEGIKFFSVAQPAGVQKRLARVRRKAGMNATLRAA